MQGGVGLPACTKQDRPTTVLIADLLVYIHPHALHCIAKIPTPCLQPSAHFQSWIILHHHSSHTSPTRTAISPLSRCSKSQLVTSKRKSSTRKSQPWSFSSREGAIPQSHVGSKALQVEHLRQSLSSLALICLLSECLPNTMAKQKLPLWIWTRSQDSLRNTI